VRDAQRVGEAETDVPVDPDPVYHRESAKREWSTRTATTLSPPPKVKNGVKGHSKLE